MKILDLERLLEFHGDLKLSEMATKLKGNNIYLCPKCNGTGIEKVCVRPEEYGYWDARYEDRDCDLCKGIGYTSYRYKPKMIQQGWE